MKSKIKLKLKKILEEITKNSYEYYRARIEIINDYSSFLTKLISLLTGFILTSLIFYLASLGEQISLFDTYIVSSLFLLFILLLILTIWTSRIERIAAQYFLKEKKSYIDLEKLNDLEQLIVQFKILNIQIHTVNIISSGTVVISVGLLFIAKSIKLGNLASVLYVILLVSFIVLVIPLTIMRIIFWHWRKRSS